MTDQVVVILTVRDAAGLEWKVGGLLADEATRRGGQCRPTILVLKDGAHVTAVTAVDQDRTVNGSNPSEVGRG